MAEAFLNSLYGNKYKAYSAGIEPAKVNSHARAAIKNWNFLFSKKFALSTTESADAAAAMRKPTKFFTCTEKKLETRTPATRLD